MTKKAKDTKAAMVSPVRGIKRPIDQMNFDQLRREVQETRDDLAMMKRRYEDLLYNLDSDNFCSQLRSSLVRERDNLRSEINMTAEGIETLVEKSDELSRQYSEVKQTAEGIETRVGNVEDDLETNYSTATQTAEMIQTQVSGVETSVDGKLKNYSTITQTNSKISAAVSEAKNYTDGAKSELSTNITNTAGKIIMVAQAAYSNPIEVTAFNAAAANTSRVYYASSNKIYYYYDGESWQSSANANFGSVFEQTASGFKLSGKVLLRDEVSVGESSDNVNKTIRFNGAASMGTCADHMGSKPPTGIQISASSVRFSGMGNSGNDATQPLIYYGTTGTKLLATQEWVKNNASSGTAVFG